MPYVPLHKAKHLQQGHETNSIYMENGHGVLHLRGTEIIDRFYNTRQNIHRERATTAFLTLVGSLEVLIWILRNVCFSNFLFVL